MWTLKELIGIDESVRSRYSGTRVLTEEKVGLSLKLPDDDKASQTPVRKLTFEVCGMHYVSPQFNLILLQDKINELVVHELVIDTTYSAPHQQINFYLNDGSKKTFDSRQQSKKDDFLLEFGIAI